MAQTAALLVEHRLPAVPWRQWVLSFEGPMAVRLGMDEVFRRRGRRRAGAVLPAAGLCDDDLHRTLRRPAADLGEADADDDASGGLATCVQLGLRGAPSARPGQGSPTLQRTTDLHVRDFVESGSH